MNADDKLKEGNVIVCIVGLGYVGLPLARAFSRHLRVIGCDVDEAKVAELNRGEGCLIGRMLSGGGFITGDCEDD